MDEAVALTWSTLTVRLKNLRAGAVCAGVTLLSLILAAAFVRSGWLWAGLPFLSMVGFFFFQRDQKLLFAWEDRVLALWAEEKVCMGIFVMTFANHPGPLKSTLKGMVAHMPPNADYVQPPPDAISAERCLFWIRSALHEVRLQKGVALNFGLAAFPWALWFLSRTDRVWLPLSLLPLAMILPAQAWVAFLSRKRWLRRAAAIAPWKPVPPEAFTARLDGLEWSRIQNSLRAYFYGAVTSGIPSRSSGRQERGVHVE